MLPAKSHHKSAKSHRVKTVIALVLIAVSLLLPSAQPVHAQWITADLGLFSWEVIKNVAKKSFELLKEHSALMWKQAQLYFGTRLARDAAVYIGSGFEGQGTFLWDPGELEKLGGAVVGEFLDGLSQSYFGKSACQPADLNFQVKIDLSARNIIEQLKGKVISAIPNICEEICKETAVEPVPGEQGKPDIFGLGLKVDETKVRNFVYAVLGPVAVPGAIVGVDVAKGFVEEIGALFTKDATILDLITEYNKQAKKLVNDVVDTEEKIELESGKYIWDMARYTLYGDEDKTVTPDEPEDDEYGFLSPYEDDDLDGYVADQELLQPVVVDYDEPTEFRKAFFTALKSGADIKRADTSVGTVIGHGAPFAQMVKEVLNAIFGGEVWNAEDIKLLFSEDAWYEKLQIILVDDPLRLATNGYEKPKDRQRLLGGEFILHDVRGIGGTGSLKTLFDLFEKNNQLISAGVLNVAAPQIPDVSKVLDMVYPSSQPVSPMDVLYHRFADSPVSLLPFSQVSPYFSTNPASKEFFDATIITNLVNPSSVLVDYNKFVDSAVHLQFFEHYMRETGLTVDQIIGQYNRLNTCVQSCERGEVKAPSGACTLDQITKQEGFMGITGIRTGVDASLDLGPLGSFSRNQPLGYIGTGKGRDERGVEFAKERKAKIALEDLKTLSQWGSVKESGTAQVLDIALKSQTLSEAEKHKEEVRSGANPLKDKKTPISGQIVVPGRQIENRLQYALDQVRETNAQYTGSVLADMWGVFFNSLIQKLLEEITEEGFDSELLGGPFDPGTRRLSTGAGVEALEAQYAQFLEIKKIGTPMPVLQKLVSGCDKRANEPKGFDECVIDDGWQQAITNELTLAEATCFVKKNGACAVEEREKCSPVLSIQGAFGFFDAEGSQPQTGREGLSYNSMVVLRKYRILPSSFEAAASYVRDVALKENANQSVTLNDVMCAFDEPASPYYGLVDPGWVLKLPAFECNVKGPGEFIVTENPTLSAKSIGTQLLEEPPSVQVVRDGEYCADPVSCIRESPDGQSCDNYGYCTAERDSWRFSSDTCGSLYKTCQAYGGPGGTQAFLKNPSLPKDPVCDKNNIGCLGYYRSFNHLRFDGTISPRTDDLSDTAFTFWPSKFKEGFVESTGRHNGAATTGSGTTATSIEDSIDKKWLDNVWKNARITITGDYAKGAYATVTGNTNRILTFSAGLEGITPKAGLLFGVIEPPAELPPSTDLIDTLFTISAVNGKTLTVNDAAWVENAFANKMVVIGDTQAPDELRGVLQGVYGFIASNTPNTITVHQWLAIPKGSSYQVYFTSDPSLHPLNITINPLGRQNYVPSLWKCANSFGDCYYERVAGRAEGCTLSDGAKCLPWQATAQEQPAQRAIATLEPADIPNRYWCGLPGGAGCFVSDTAVLNPSSGLEHLDIPNDGIVATRAGHSTILDEDGKSGRKCVVGSWQYNENRSALIFKAVPSNNLSEAVPLTCSLNNDKRVYLTNNAQSCSKEAAGCQDYVAVAFADDVYGMESTIRYKDTADGLEQTKRESENRFLTLAEKSEFTKKLLDVKEDFYNNLSLADKEKFDYTQIPVLGKETNIIPDSLTVVRNNIPDDDIPDLPVTPVYEENVDGDDALEIILEKRFEPQFGSGQVQIEHVPLNGKRLYCTEEEVGCRRYALKGSSSGFVAGILNPQADLCPKDCAGYALYREPETPIEKRLGSRLASVEGVASYPQDANSVDRYLIPHDEYYCREEFAGCEKFTEDLSAQQGSPEERKSPKILYLKDVRLCVAEGKSGVASYSIAESPETGPAVTDKQLLQSNYRGEIWYQIYEEDPSRVIITEKDPIPDVDGDTYTTDPKTHGKWKDPVTFRDYHGPCLSMKAGLGGNTNENQRDWECTDREDFSLIKEGLERCLIVNAEGNLVSDLKNSTCREYLFPYYDSKKRGNVIERYPLPYDIPIEARPPENCKLFERALTNSTGGKYFIDPENPLFADDNPAGLSCKGKGAGVTESAYLSCREYKGPGFQTDGELKIGYEDSKTNPDNPDEQRAYRWGLDVDDFDSAEDGMPEPILTSNINGAKNSALNLLPNKEYRMVIVPDPGNRGLSKERFRGKSFKLALWIKGSAKDQIVTVGLKDDADVSREFKVTLPNGALGSYTTPDKEWHGVTFNQVVSEAEWLPVYFYVISGGEFALDNIALTASSNIFLLQDALEFKNYSSGRSISSHVPNSCNTNYNIAAPELPRVDTNNPIPYQLGCLLYTTDRGEEVPFKAIKGCREEGIGCRAVINTFNTRSIDKATVSIGGDEGSPDSYFVPADALEFVVDKPENRCGELGCTLFGTEETNQAGGVTAFSENYLVDNPDLYKDTGEPRLCKQEAEGCALFTAVEDGGLNYFKAPGKRACRFISGTQANNQDNQEQGGWYKKKDDGSYEPCLTYKDSIHPEITRPLGYCVEQGTGRAVFDTRVEVSEPAKTAWCDLSKTPQTQESGAGNPQHTNSAKTCLDFIDKDGDGAPGDPEGMNAGIDEAKVICVPTAAQCPAEQSRCTEFIDPLNDGVARYYFQINDAKLGEGKCEEGIVNDKAGCRVFNDTSLPQDTSLTYNAKKSDEQGAVNQSCNPPYLDCYKADGTFKDASPNPEPMNPACKKDIGDVKNAPQCDANRVIPVERDRTCGEWLACQTWLVVDQGENESKTACLSRAPCNVWGPNGECLNFVDNAKNQFSRADILPLNAGGSNPDFKEDFTRLTSLSGLSKMGYFFSFDQDDAYTPYYTPLEGFKPFDQMQELGVITVLKNGGFENFIQQQQQILSPGDNFQVTSTAAPSFVKPQNWAQGKECGESNCVLEWRYKSVNADASKNDNVKSGRFSLRLSGGAVYQDIKGVLPNTTYSLSYFAKVGTQGKGADMSVKIDTTVTSDQSDKSRTPCDTYAGIPCIPDDFGIKAIGNEWQYRVGTFTTLSNSSSMRIYLVGYGGVVFFDDVELRPHLEVRVNAVSEDKYVPPTCRLYPESNALQCDARDSSGSLIRGWRGYCLERDPRDSRGECVNWAPIDVIQGETNILGKIESSALDLPSPLYYCAEAMDKDPAVVFSDSRDKGTDGSAMPRLVCLARYSPGTGGDLTKEACAVVALATDPKPKFYSAGNESWYLGVHAGKVVNVFNKNEYQVRLAASDNGPSLCLYGPAGTNDFQNPGRDPIVCNKNCFEVEGLGAWHKEQGGVSVFWNRGGEESAALNYGGCTSGNWRTCYEKLRDYYHELYVFIFNSKENDPGVCEDGAVPGRYEWIDGDVPPDKTVNTHAYPLSGFRREQGIKTEVHSDSFNIPVEYYKKFDNIASLMANVDGSLIGENPTVGLGHCKTEPAWCNSGWDCSSSSNCVKIETKNRQARESRPQQCRTLAQTVDESGEHKVWAQKYIGNEALTPPLKYTKDGTQCFPYGAIPIVGSPNDIVRQPIDPKQKTKLPAVSVPLELYHLENVDNAEEGLLCKETYRGEGFYAVGGIQPQCDGGEDYGKFCQSDGDCKSPGKCGGISSFASFETLEGHGLSRITQLFAKVYKAFRWQKSSNQRYPGLEEGEYAPINSVTDVTDLISVCTSIRDSKSCDAAPGCKALYGGVDSHDCVPNAGYRDYNYCKSLSKSQCNESSEPDVCIITPVLTCIPYANPYPRVQKIVVDKTKLQDRNREVKLTFDAEAPANQKPIKSVIIDWGDCATTLITGVSWEDKTRTFRHAYKFYGSLDVINQQSDQCKITLRETEDPLQYFCRNYPDAGGTWECRYSPKVTVIDNWGWCNGTHPSGNAGDGYAYGLYAGQCLTSQDAGTASPKTIRFLSPTKADVSPPTATIAFYKQLPDSSVTEVTTITAFTAGYSAVLKCNDNITIAQCEMAQEGNDPNLIFAQLSSFNDLIRRNTACSSGSCSNSTPVYFSAPNGQGPWTYQYKLKVSDGINAVTYPPSTIQITSKSGGLDLALPEATLTFKQRNTDSVVTVVKALDTNYTATLKCEDDVIVTHCEIVPELTNPLGLIFYELEELNRIASGDTDCRVGLCTIGTSAYFYPPSGGGPWTYSYRLKVSDDAHPMRILPEGGDPYSIQVLLGS